MKNLGLKWKEQWEVPILHEVLVQSLGIESWDSVVEMARLESDQENEKKVAISSNSGIETVGLESTRMCLETEKLEWIEVSDGNHESKPEGNESSEKRAELEGGVQDCSRHIHKGQ